VAPVDVTIPTSILPLTAAALKVKCETIKRQPLRRHEAEYPGAANYTLTIMDNLEQRLNKCVTENDFTESGCFAKLTTRSPKDCTAAQEKAKNAFQHRKESGEFGHYQDRLDETEDHSAVLGCIWRRAATGTISL
jgi:hypothetical protein